MVSTALAASWVGIAAASGDFDFACSAHTACRAASALPRRLAAAFCFSSSARALAWSVFAVASFVGERELGVGAGLEPFPACATTL